MTQIQDSVALVTGGQRGLGKAFANQLLERGAAKVYVTARNPQVSDDPRIVPLALEVTDAASIAALAEQVGDVQIVFNNAGIFAGESILRDDIDTLRELYEVNVFGPVQVAKALAPILAANGGGALLNTLSNVAWASGFGSYGSTKAAFWGITNTLRIELREQGTQVVGIYLGFTDTDMVASVDAPKNDPIDVANRTLDALEAGENEALTDDGARYIKSLLSGPVENYELPALAGASA